MPLLSRNEKVTCENCDKNTGRRIRTDIAIVACEELFFARNVIIALTKSKINLHASKKHVKSTLNSTNFLSFQKEFPS